MDPNSDSVFTKLKEQTSKLLSLESGRAAPQAEFVALRARFDHAAKPLSPHPQGRLDLVEDAMYPDPRLTTPWPEQTACQWANRLRGACNHYVRGDYEGLWRAVPPNGSRWERALDETYFRHPQRSFRVVGMMKKKPTTIYGGILHHREACFPVDDSLLPGEAICAVTFLGRQRAFAREEASGRIRLASVTATAIRVLDVALDGDDQHPSVSIRVLKTAQLDDISMSDWTQLVFLTVHETVSEAKGGKLLVRKAEDRGTGGKRIVSEDLGFAKAGQSKSSGGEQSSSDDVSSDVSSQE